MTHTPSALTWDVPEFEERFKDPLWLLGSIVIAALLLVFALWQKNFLFAIFVMVAEGMVVAWGNRAPRILQCRIDDHGVSVLNFASYPYRDLDTFAFVEREGVSDLVLIPRRRLRMLITIPIPTHHIEAARALLDVFLDEVEHEESWIDALARLLRF